MTESSTPVTSTSQLASSSSLKSIIPRLRPNTSRSRPRTVATSTAISENEIICSITESRGIVPTIGLSFVNLSTCEAVLCQFADTQTYARTCHKIKVFSPSEILYMSSIIGSKIIAVIEESLEVEKCNILMTSIDRRYWSETTGHEYIERLSFPDNLESLRMSVAGNYFATCCFAAIVKYVELGMSLSFAAETLRIRFEPSEGSMMIDLSTMSSLELIQNLQHAKSKDSLFGLLQQTLTPMGSRILRSNVLQPSTEPKTILTRYEALEELVTKEGLFFAVRDGLNSFVDTDRVLAALVILPTKIDLQYMEQSVNNILMLKTFVSSIKSLWQALVGVQSEELQRICQLCNFENYSEVQALIDYALNENVTYSKQPSELRNQRVYAIKAGVNSFLDIARQTYKEITQDILDSTSRLKDRYDINADLKFDPARQFYLRISISELGERQLPDVFINIFYRKKMIECQTLDLIKMNQKSKDAHNEVILLSDRSIQDLIERIRSKIHPLFKISEGIAMLDMLAGMAHLITTQDYVRPELTDTLGIRSGRHPIREKIHKDKFVPNDVYATQQERFQIITGCNMSGKSTYTRSIALMTIMAQIGCFVPAQYASFPIVHQLFARVSTDDSIEANVSSFASEMQEVAFILRNIEPRSLVIIDELGRGTSTTDGLAIAIAIAEALIASKAFVWFVTHFRELPRILAERAGVVNLHLTVNIAQDMSEMKMNYQVSDGYEEEKFYGLALAKVIDLPREVFDVAGQVSQLLHQRNEAKKSNAKSLAVARRRKAVLNLREQLMQARQSKINPEELRQYLKRLQHEFVVRMKAIDAEALVGPPTMVECELNDDQQSMKTKTSKTSNVVRAENGELFEYQKQDPVSEADVSSVQNYPTTVLSSNKIQSQNASPYSYSDRGDG